MVCLRRISFLLPLCFLVSVVAGSAQLQPEPSDPLARIRDAAKNNAQACSATGERLCEQVAPKIIANAEGDSPLAENFLRLEENLRARENSHGTSAVALALAAFRGAGVEVHTERYDASNPAAAAPMQEHLNVVAEIRGREKPDEWVLLGTHFNLSGPASSLAGGASNAAMVIEAARDIQLTGVRPRRSIRFVLFDGEGLGATGSWAYVKTHRDDLEREAAAILVLAGESHVDGFVLNGRQEIESGVHEAVKPIESWEIRHYVIDAPLQMESVDFVLEGIPTIIMSRVGGTPVWQEKGIRIPEKSDIKELKRNTAIAAVVAFGIAERSELLGPRQSRAEIDSLLKATDLDVRMKAAGVWPLWETGQRGRLP